MSFEQDAVIIEPASPHRGSVIWLHGLGADGHDFEPVAPELGLPAEAGARFIFPHAPFMAVTINGGQRMRAWYDIRCADLRQQEDAAAIRASAELIERYIRAEQASGIPARRIILAGFSQGGGAGPAHGFALCRQPGRDHRPVHLSAAARAAAGRGHGREPGQPRIYGAWPRRSGHPAGTGPGHGRGAATGRLCRGLA